jgi:hypothetical protein
MSVCNGITQKQNGMKWQNVTVIRIGQNGSESRFDILKYCIYTYLRVLMQYFCQIYSEIFRKPKSFTKQNNTSNTRLTFRLFP